MQIFDLIYDRAFKDEIVEFYCHCCVNIVLYDVYESKQIVHSVQLFAIQKLNSSSFEKFVFILGNEIKVGKWTRVNVDVKFLV